jgi:hypothetical protein
MADKQKAKLRKLSLEDRAKLTRIHEGLRNPLISDHLVCPSYAHLPRGDSKYEQQGPYSETD